MVNKSKAKGTVAETAFVTYARTHGFPYAERFALHGTKDVGDVRLTSTGSVIVEIKNHQAPASVGQPSASQLSHWMLQTREERNNARAKFAFLVVKRSGTQDVGRWFCYVPASALFYLSHIKTPALMRSPVVCLPTADMLHMVRVAGFGEHV